MCNLLVLSVDFVALITYTNLCNNWINCVLMHIFLEDPILQGLVFTNV